MIGLMVIGAFAAYGLLTWWLARLGAHVARNRDLPGSVGGGTVVLAMYLLVFWDWIPTVVAHRYYCATQAGFEVYKTLERWKAENPGVAETLVPVRGVIVEDAPDGLTFPLNQRFGWRVSQKEVFLSVRKIVYVVRDKASAEVLSQRVDFSAGTGKFPAGATTLHDYKFWLVSNSCKEFGYESLAAEEHRFMKPIEMLGVTTSEQGSFGSGGPGRVR